MRNLSSIFVILILSGCVHVKYACTSISPRYEREQIVTKHKYKIVKDSNLADWNEIFHLNQSLQHCQPEVFAADGIAIQLKKGRAYDNDGKVVEKAEFYEDGNLSFLFAISSCFILPYYQSAETTRKYSIVIDKSKYLSPVVIKTKEEQCVSVLSPLAPLLSWVWMDWGVPDKDNIWEVSHSLGVSRNTCSNEKDRALAYALALRLKAFEETGVNVRETFKSQTALDEITGTAALPKYKVVEWLKKNDSYVFKLSFPEANNITAAMIRMVEKDFASTVISRYLEDEPSANRNDLQVFYSVFDFRGRFAEGEAVVISLQLELEKSYYDSTTRRGKIAVRVVPSKYEQAREWIRRNIAELARDKNIRLTAGVIPDEASFYIGKETYENGVLEMEFKTE